MTIAASYGTVSDIEILWVLLAVIGIVFTLFNLGEARADWRWIRSQQIGNGRRTLASAGLQMESIRLAIQVIFLIIGLLAMTTPDAPPRVLNWKEVAVQGVATWGLILSSALLTYKTYLARRVRRRLAEERIDNLEVTA